MDERRKNSKMNNLGSNDLYFQYIQETFQENLNSRGKSQHHPRKLQKEKHPSKIGTGLTKNGDGLMFDDEFGMLLDWTTQLDERDLGDFQVA